MTAPSSPTSAPDTVDSEYEDLLGQWSDLESALSVLLARPRSVQDFSPKLRQCDRWLQDLVAHDIDAALYLMFQLAATSTVGYSAAHALGCATLCHILAQELQLPAQERDSLVRAAFSMNIAMTALQDELAQQREPLTPAQRRAVDQHPRAGMDLLEELGISDELWLELVGHRKWAVLMKDDRIRRRPTEVAALKDAGIHAFCIANANLLAAEMARLFLQHEETIFAMCRTTGPTLHSIAKNGLRPIDL